MVLFFLIFINDMFVFAIRTPCPSVPVIYTPVASPFDNFAEVTVPNYAYTANKWKNRVPRSYRDFITGDFWEIAAPN